MYYFPINKWICIQRHYYRCYCFTLMMLVQGNISRPVIVYSWSILRLI